MASELSDDFKAKIVASILDSNPELALATLSSHFNVEEPTIRVGVVKRHSRDVRAVYTPRKKEILASKREYLYDPFTVLHEFYHHLRSFGDEHRGTERHADNFALDFIRAYNTVVSRLT